MRKETGNHLADNHGKGGGLMNAPSDSIRTESPRSLNEPILPNVSLFASPSSTVQSSLTSLKTSKQKFQKSVNAVMAINALSSSLKVNSIPGRGAIETHPLSPAKILMTLINCIKNQIFDQSSLTQEEMVVFVGNTGSGKSTTMNFLFGCQLGYVSGDLSQIARSLEVISSPDNGHRDAVAKIGHSHVSETYVPSICECSDSNLLFCDFPGFLDNRGPLVGIANSICIANILNASCDTKFLICIRYSSLMSDGAKSLRHMMESLMQLFGSQEMLKEHAGSMLLGITCAPEHKLEAVKQMLATVLNEYGMGDLVENTTLICPVVRTQHSNDNFYNAPSDFSREATLTKLKCLKGSHTVVSGKAEGENVEMSKKSEKTPSKFQSPISPSNKMFLVELGNNLGDALLEKMEKISLDASFNHATPNELTLISELCDMLLETKCIGNLLKDLVQKKMDSWVVTTKQLFYSYCVPGVSFQEKEARQILEQIRKYCIMFEEDERLFTILQQFLENAIHDQHEYSSARKEEAELISAQLRLQDIFQEVLKSQPTDHLKNKFDDTVLLIQEELGKLDNESVRDRHQFMLDDTIKMFKKKVNDYELVTSQVVTSQKEDHPTQLNISATSQEEDHPTQPKISATTNQGNEKLMTQHMDLVENEPRLHPLLKQKLVDPCSKFSLKQRLELLQVVIQVATDRGMKADKKDLVVLLGNPGAGKSMVVNLLGNSENVETASIPAPFLTEVINLEGSSEVVFKACGFEDPRGLEINFANAISLAQGVRVANRAKFILLINFYSLDADRCNGLTDLMFAFTELFGGEEQVLSNLQTILIGITQVPDDENDSSILNTVKRIFKSKSSDFPMLEKMTDLIFIVRPQDPMAPNQIQRKIAELSWTPRRSFQAQLILSPSDQDQLRILVSNALDAIHDLFENKKMVDSLHLLKCIRGVLRGFDLFHHSVSITIESELKRSTMKSLTPSIETMNTELDDGNLEQAEKCMETIAQFLDLVDADTLATFQKDYAKHREEAAQAKFYEKSQQRYLENGQDLEKKFLDTPEVAALLQLFRSTNGEQWRSSKKWLVSDDIGKWYGIKCNAQGEVVSLSLPNNGLNGVLPDDLFQPFQALEHLNLKGNDLHGELPNSLRGLKNLREFYLDDNCNLCGPILDFSHDVNFTYSNTSLGTVGDIVMEYSTFPFWVVSCERFLELESIISHEDAQKEPGVLLLLRNNNPGTNFQSWSIHGGLEKHETFVSREEIMFISHRWPGNFPDDDDKTKLEQLKNIIRHEQFRHIKYLWMDYFCVPQDRSNSEKQQRAINSLPHYVKCCETFITLIGNSGYALGDIYYSRGWCRMERFAALTPVVQTTEASILTRVFEHNKDTNQVVDFQEDIGNREAKLDPQEGEFTDDGDKEKIGSALAMMSKSMVQNGRQKSVKDLGQYMLNKPELRTYIEDELGSKKPFYRVGDRVICKHPYYRGRSDDPWFAGVIIDISGNVLSVRYDDGDMGAEVLNKWEIWYAPSAPSQLGQKPHRFNSLEELMDSYETRFSKEERLLPKVESGKDGGVDEAIGTVTKNHEMTYKVGDRVICKHPPYSGREDDPWYAGTITSISEDSLRVHYDSDGTSHEDEPSKWEILYAPLALSTAGAPGSHRFNDLVELMESYEPQERFAVEERLLP